MSSSRCVVMLSLALVGVGAAFSAETPSPQSRAEANDLRADAGDPHLPGMKKITIRGFCLDERGTPVANARVRVFRYPSRLDAPLLVTDIRADGDGKFVVEQIATAIGEAHFAETGDLCVAASAEGHVSAIRRIDKETLLAAAPTIDPFAPPSAIRQDKDVIELSFELGDSPGTLSGTVTDESGRPVSGVTVFLPSIFQQPLPGIQSAVTDEAGRYVITDLNRWTVGEAAGGPGNSKERPVTTSVVFLLDHPDYARTTAHYAIVPQSVPLSVDVTLHPPAILEGAVVDAVTHRPAANVVVSAQGVARYGWHQTRTDGQGRYRLRMTKDHYNIWAEAEDRIAIAAKAVKAEPGKTVSVAEIPLVRGGFVTGRVVVPAAKAAAGPAADSPLRVAHYGPARPRTGAAVTSVEVDADGTFRLRVAPGWNYVYLMSGGARSSQIVSVDDGQEVKVDLGAGNRNVSDAFTDDLQLAASLQKQAQIEDLRQKMLLRRVVPEPTPRPALRQREQTPAAR